MKKTVIALACVMISGGAMAASLTHGTTTIHVTGSGTFDSQHGSRIQTEYYDVRVVDQSDPTGGTYVEKGGYDENFENTVTAKGTIATNQLTTKEFVQSGSMAWGTASMNGGTKTFTDTGSGRVSSSITNWGQHYATVWEDGVQVQDIEFQAGQDWDQNVEFNETVINTSFSSIFAE